ncbi:MAG: hypothetical protein DYG86_01320 [Chloroflexi bacterium CFX2]|nr:hypothetical protein [Chloroflexi bacterium CFX2]
MNKKLLVLLLAVFMLSACAPDPRKEAQAFAIESEAQQKALDQEQARTQDEELHNIVVQQEEVELQKERANAAVWVRIADTFITSLIALLLVGLTAVVYEVSRTAKGIGNAMVIAAETRANLIPLNPTTRQYPLFIKHVSGHRFAVHNPNTGSVILLDERNEADRQMIASVAQVQVSGVLASEARQSNDPAGMAMIRPPMIDVKADGMWIGDSFIKDAIPLITGNEEHHAG